jgi:hypothetical protein
MSSQVLFQIQLVLIYLAWLLCFGVYLWPPLKAAKPVRCPTCNSDPHIFRFFGIVFILPGVVGPDLPAGFATRRLAQSSCGTSNGKPVSTRAPILRAPIRF